jgi:hypothetical protein
MEFSKYLQVPQEIIQKLIEEKQKQKKDSWKKSTIKMN